MISTAILAVLSLIEQILPLLGTASATTSLIENIIGVMTKLLPYIIDEISTVYTAVKNIIAQLQNSGAPTADQLTALQSLDTQVDIAWNNIQAQFDPDAPPAA